MSDANNDVIPEFEFVDPNSKQKVKLPAKIGDVDLKSMLDGVIKKSRHDVTSEFEKKYQPVLEQVGKYESDNSELREALQKLEDEKLTAEERVQKQIQRESENYKKQVDAAAQKAMQFEGLFKKTTEENALVGEFSSRQDVVNSRQAYMLMKSEFPVEVVEKDGSYKVVVLMPSDTGDMEELDPKTAVERWLALPEHRHFLKSNLAPGSGSSSTARKMSDGTLVYTRADISNEAKRKEYFEKKKAGEPVEIRDE